MHALSDHKFTPAEVAEVQQLATSNASPAIRDLLLDRSKSLENGDRLIALGDDSSCSPAEASKLIGMSRTHLYKLLDRGDIPFHTVGTHRRILFQDLIQFRNKMHADRLELAEKFAHQDRLKASANEEIANLL